MLEIWIVRKAKNISHSSSYLYIYLVISYTSLLVIYLNDNGESHGEAELRRTPTVYQSHTINGSNICSLGARCYQWHKIESDTCREVAVLVSASSLASEADDNFSMVVFHLSPRPPFPRGTRSRRHPPSPSDLRA